MVSLRPLLLAAALTCTSAWLPTPPASSASKFKIIDADNKMNKMAPPLQQSSRALDIPTQKDELDELADYSMARVGLSPKLPLRGADIRNGNVHEFTPWQQFSRIAPILTLAAYAYNQEPFDAATQVVWDCIYSWDITHTGLFEAHVAAFSFVFFIACFSCTHLFLGKGEEKTQRMAKYRLDGQEPNTNPLSWATLTLEGIKEWSNPLVSYLVSILIYQQVFQTYHEPIDLAPTFGVLVVEVMAGVFLYDLFFAPVHLLLHKGPLKDLRQAHGYHHRHTDGSLNPVETVQHSYVDGGLQVMVNILVQHISPFGGPKHMLSRIIHNIMVTYLLTESHSGYNFSWMSHNIWPEFLGGSPRHERHHKDGRVYYQQFFTYMDDAMGWNDQDVKEQMIQKQERRQEQQTREEAFVVDEMDDHVSEEADVKGVSMEESSVLTDVLA